MKSTSKKRTPSIVNLTVKRRYLTQREIERLMDCARKHGRYGHRDATHDPSRLSARSASLGGLRPAVAADRAIRGPPARALRKLRRDYPTDAHVYVFERGGPISPIGFHRLVQRLGEAAKMPFPIHPHMLRHACGFKLANDGHDTRALQ